MGIYHGEYNSDVAHVLDKRYPGKNLLRFGAEVETGWHDEETRSAFFRKLEARGLDKFCISKHDSSIAASLASEIVTMPMKYNELSTALYNIGEVLEKETNRSVMQNCGVHIHATLDPLPQEALWRILTAIMTDKNAPARWLVNRRTSELQNAYNAYVEELNEFWTKVALRRPTGYCKRYSHDSLEHALIPNHTSAISKGKHTPTLEFRLFKSARSPKVLASYPEVVAALIAFSTDPPKELLIPTEAEDPAKTAYEEALRKVLQILYDSDEFMDYIGSNFHGYTRQEMRTRIDSNRWRFALEPWWRTFLSVLRNGYTWENMANRADPFSGGISPALWRLLLEHRKPLMYNERDDGGRRTLPGNGWKDFMFPIRLFGEYVFANKAQYPNFAERLLLPKFNDHFAIERGVWVGESMTPFPDESRPHDKIEVGCRVRPQSHAVGSYRVSEITKKTPKVIAPEDIEVEAILIAKTGTCPNNEEYEDGYEYTSPVTDFIHICSGATREEGFTE